MSSGRFHNPYSCNKCGKENEVACDPFNNEAPGETKTKCKECGHEDYWHYGFFESSEDGLDSCSKY